MTNMSGGENDKHKIIPGPENGDGNYLSEGQMGDLGSGNVSQGNNYGHSSGNYIDSNWASGFFIEPNNEMLFNMDFNNANIGGESGSGALMAGMQYPTGQAPSMGSDDKGFEQQAQINNSAGNAESSDSNSNSSQKVSQQGAMAMKPAGKQRRPCDHCRRRKTKCVIIPNTNNCVQCESKSLTCTYVGRPEKRKGFESESSQNVKRRNGSDEKEEDQINGSVNSAILGGSAINVPSNAPIRNVPPVQDYSSINNSLLKKTLSLQFPRSSFYVGPTSYLYDINLLNSIIESRNKSQAPSKQNGKIDQIDLNSTISLRKVSDRVQFVLRDDQSAQSYQTMSNDVDTIEKFIAPHGQILIDLYFRIIHPSYPILHKKVFLEKYARTHREFSAPLLAAVYVLAIQWWDYDPQLNRFPKPNVEMILKIGLNNYLLEVLKRPKLSAVQSGLLLLQCKHGLSSLPRNNNQNSVSPISATIGDESYSEWVLCSQVVSIAEELGLGLDCNNWKLPKWERGLRKRLAWAAYMEDKWLSLKNSRPSHIHDSNWVVVSLAEEDFPEKHGDGDLKEGSSDIDNGKKIFMNLIELSKVLSDILNQFYSMRAMSELSDVSSVLNQAKPIQLKLRNWYHSLPVELQMNSVQPRKLCSNGYLQLAYFATELTLHRKIVTTIYQQSLAGNYPPKELVSVCRTAAKTRLLASIEFVRDLKPEHIHSFWNSSASSNFTLIGTFAALLFISSTSKEEADYFRDQLFNYRWILKISSKGFEQVAEALQKLDLVLNHVPGLLNDGVGMPVFVQNMPSMTSPSKTSSPYQPSSAQMGHPNSAPTHGRTSSNTSNNGMGVGQGSQVTKTMMPVQAPLNYGTNSPNESPQSYTSQISQPQPAHTASMGSHFPDASPQNSQTYSPKDNMKSRHSMPNHPSRNEGDVKHDVSPKSNDKKNGLNITRSPHSQVTRSSTSNNETLV